MCPKSFYVKSVGHVCFPESIYKLHILSLAAVGFALALRVVDMFVTLNI